MDGTIVPSENLTLINWDGSHCNVSIRWFLDIPSPLDFRQSLSVFNLINLSTNVFLTIRMGSGGFGLSKTFREEKKHLRTEKKFCSGATAEKGKRRFFYDLPKVGRCDVPSPVRCRDFFLVY